KLDKDLVIDLDKEEEDFEGGEGPTDFPIAKLANTDQYTLLQLDGKIQPALVKEVLQLTDEACEKIYDIQKKALKEVIEQ
ncbi:MAG TPA: exosome complex exonuclease Rrp41, partial [Candidatus Nanoarchaeia archaeon]|nr:exosome complex exonuclease Rrp41 [Candidatus Nanoarchaeia archaeon]